jgi:hypothetical protein
VPSSPRSRPSARIYSRPLRVPRFRPPHLHHRRSARASSASPSRSRVRPHSAARASPCTRSTSSRARRPSRSHSASFTRTYLASSARCAPALSGTRLLPANCPRSSCLRFCCLQRSPRTARSRSGSTSCPSKQTAERARLPWASLVRARSPCCRERLTDEHLCPSKRQAGAHDPLRRIALRAHHLAHKCGGHRTDARRRYVVRGGRVRGAAREGAIGPRDGRCGSLLSIYLHRISVNRWGRV